MRQVLLLFPVKATFTFFIFLYGNFFTHNFELHISLYMKQSLHQNTTIIFPPSDMKRSLVLEFQEPPKRIKRYHSFCYSSADAAAWIEQRMGINWRLSDAGKAHAAWLARFYYCIGLICKQIIWPMHTHAWDAKLCFWKTSCNNWIPMEIWSGNIPNDMLWELPKGHYLILDEEARRDQNSRYWSQFGYMHTPRLHPEDVDIHIEFEIEDDTPRVYVEDHEYAIVQIEDDD